MQDIMKNTVYDMEWQALRVSLLGKWVTNIGAADNITRLRVYMETDMTVSKLWRIINLLNGTRMGFHGMKLIDTPMDKQLVTFRTEVQRLYKQMLRDGARHEELTEEHIREGWRKLDKPTQDKILLDLQKRLSLHQESLHREDLRWVIKILLDERTRK